MLIRIAGLVPESFVDGDGIRFAIFMQGCLRNCAGCHNPHTHDLNGGKIVDTQEIIAAVKKNPLLDGITLTGGEPFLQIDAANEIACPADGKILSIKTEDDPNVLVIRIFLSIFNVHIQRATIDGQVEDTVYTKGSFAFANNPSADKNERNLIKIKNGEKFAHVEQITGAIARRIECWVKKDEQVKAGQKVGVIYFGSQVAVYLPKDKVVVTVKEGQSVQGALSVLGLWKD